MRRMAVILSLALGCGDLAAASHVAFGIDAFNRAISVSTRGSVVFSPASFEFDCVIFSEAVGPIVRAHFAEKMGVLNGLEQVYEPMYRALTDSSVTNRFTFRSARAFCLPDERKAHPAYRQWMQRTFSTESFSYDFRRGAEIWFRSRLDGAMDDFRMPDRAATEGYYSFIDVLYICYSWREAFPTDNTREFAFQLESDDAAESVRIPMLCDLRNADIWTCKNHTVLRLPLAHESWFFALLPRDGLKVGDIRRYLTSANIQDTISGMNSIVEKGLYHGPAAIVLPRINITSEVNLSVPFSYFEFPVTGLERIPADLEPRAVRQIVRFRLDESGCDAAPLAKKPEEAVVRAKSGTPRLVLNRPFLFFIYNEPTAMIVAAGQFTGR